MAIMKESARDRQLGTAEREVERLQRNKAKAEATLQTVDAELSAAQQRVGYLKAQPVRTETGEVKTGESGNSDTEGDQLDGAAVAPADASSLVDAQI